MILISKLLFDGAQCIIESRTEQLKENGHKSKIEKGVRVLFGAAAYPRVFGGRGAQLSASFHK